MLAATAVAQAIVVILTGSVALLADTIHNFTDALTAIPLLIAFRLGRRPANHRYTYGYHRAEDVAGLAIVAMIAASAVFAAVEAIDRLRHPAPIDHVWVVLAAGVIGFLGNEAVAIYRMRVGRDDRLGGPRRRRGARPRRRVDLARRRGRRHRGAGRLPSMPTRSSGSSSRWRSATRWSTAARHGAPPRARRDRRTHDAPDRGVGGRRRGRGARVGGAGAVGGTSAPRRARDRRVSGHLRRGRARHRRARSRSAAARRSPAGRRDGPRRPARARFPPSGAEPPSRPDRPSAAPRTIAVHMDETSLPPPPAHGPARVLLPASERRDGRALHQVRHVRSAPSA